MNDTGPSGSSGVLVAHDTGLALRSHRDVLDLIGAAYDADGIVLTADDVDPSFFDLRSGLAGELFQKVTNYGLRLALVLPDPAAHGQRWCNLAHEHAHHGAIRIVATRSEAEAWVRGAPP